KRPTIIEPIQPLGTVATQYRITHDPGRRLHGVHLAYGEGILVCPTGAGEVLGIDIMSRSLAWAYPYRDQLPSQSAMNPNMVIRQPIGIRPDMMNLGNSSPPLWHPAPPVIQDGKVVFTAADAHSVHCINLRDGTPVWKKRQSENDMYLAGIYG